MASILIPLLAVATIIEVFVLIALIAIISKKKKKAEEIKEVRAVKTKTPSARVAVKPKKESHFFRNLFSKIDYLAGYPFMMLGRGIDSIKESWKEHRKNAERNKKLREAREAREEEKRREQEKIEEEKAKEERRAEELHRAKLALLFEQRLQVQQLREFEEAKYEARKEARRNGRKKSKPINWLMVLAFGIPIAIFVFFLYINFLPFGYSKNYTITIDENGTVHSSSSQVYLEDLKGNKITNLTEVYDYGQINLVVKPKVVLRNAVVNASIVNSNESDVYFAKTDFNSKNQSWDYFWDFSKGIPAPLNGTAQYDPNKSCVYFNGSNNETLQYPNSSEMFENDSFVVYAEWMPEDANGTNQQIIGHYNWELWQKNDSVRFMIGRLEDKNGNMPSIEYKINSSEFFNKKHELVAVYKADKNNSRGYMELYVDNNFVGRKTINNQIIWKEYWNRNLTFGWSPHNYGNNHYYTGCTYTGGFDYRELEHNQNAQETITGKEIKTNILGSGKPEIIKLNISKKPKWTMTTSISP